MAATLLTGSLLTGFASACGGTGAAKRPTSAQVAHGYVRIDGDADDDDRPKGRPSVNDDRELFEIYGRTAPRADAYAIRQLLASYYAAAAAGNAVTVCSLLHADLAAQLAAHAALFAPGAQPSCPAAMSALLAQQHRRFLAEDVATMTVTSVHVNGDIGLAVLGFRRVPQAAIALERQGGTWKMDALFDSDLT